MGRLEEIEARLSAIRDLALWRGLRYLIERLRAAETALDDITPWSAEGRTEAICQCCLRSYYAVPRGTHEPSCTYAAWRALAEGGVENDDS